MVTHQVQTLQLPTLSLLFTIRCSSLDRQDSNKIGKLKFSLSLPDFSYIITVANQMETFPKPKYHRTKFSKHIVINRVSPRMVLLQLWLVSFTYVILENICSLMALKCFQTVRYLNELYQQTFPIFLFFQQNMMLSLRNWLYFIVF